MSTPENEVKAAVAQAESNLAGDATKAASQVQAKAALEVSALKQRVASLELDAEAFYKRHATVMIVIAVVALALLIWRAV